jgi:aromatic-L-amino-acid decarboxylase
MDEIDFRKWSHRAADWGADYHATLRNRPVRAQTQPGEIAAKIAAAPPEAGEGMDAIFADFERIIPDGMTHWQHPRFFAYFPSNAAPAAIVAEQLAGAMAAQGMLWQTSPALTELEVKMIDWLRQAVDLPQNFKGVLQDTASSATLCAVLTMRERTLNWAGNREGLSG